MGEIKKRLPLQCPACDAPLRVGRLFCEECRTEVCGDFELPVLKALNSSSGYEDFKKNLAEESIRVTEHVNGKGAYGISFYMENVEDPHIFKGAELSRQLTYRNIQRHFDGVAIGFSSHIDRVGELDRKSVV